MSSSGYKFEGWVGHNKASVDGELKWEEFNPKPFKDNDVDIKIECCGVCGSDLHTLRSGWAPTPYPVVVGHEIVGKAVRVGDAVKDIKVGDRVGVGAQSSSCKKPDCEACGQSMEQCCPHRGSRYLCGQVSRWQQILRRYVTYRWQFSHPEHARETR